MTKSTTQADREAKAAIHRRRYTETARLVEACWRGREMTQEELYTAVEDLMRETSDRPLSRRSAEMLAEDFISAVAMS